MRTNHEVRSASQTIAEFESDFICTMQVERQSNAYSSCSRSDRQPLGQVLLTLKGHTGSCDQRGVQPRRQAHRSPAAVT